MLCPVTYSVVRSGNVMSSILPYSHVTSCLEKEKENFTLLFLSGVGWVGKLIGHTGHIDQALTGALTASGSLVRFPAASACP